MTHIYHSRFLISSILFLLSLLVLIGVGHDAPQSQMMTYSIISTFLTCFFTLFFLFMFLHQRKADNESYFNDFPHKK